MIQKAIDRILELADPYTMDIGGITYSNKKMYKLDNEMRADPIAMTTLSGLVDYIRASESERKFLTYIVHVVSPTRVELISALDDDRDREVLAIVNAEVPIIPFGRYIDNETMLITVQSMFQDGDDTDKAIILQFAGNVTAGSVKQYKDDGVTQKATIKQGVASKAEAVVPSPCILKPYRTFIEVDQPKSMFIFRLKEGNEKEGVVYAALYEADGGAWKNDARMKIKAYLEERLEGTDILVIA